MSRIPLSAFDLFLLHPCHHPPRMIQAVFLDFLPILELFRSGTGLAIAKNGL
jgi:hypothetical protein